MTRLVLCLALVFAFASGARATSAEQDARLARAATALVTAALADGASYEVVTEGDLRGVVELEVEKQLAGCDDASCLTDVAGALGARYVVMGQLDRVGAQLVLNLTLFDNEEARVVARTGINAATEDELAARLPPAARRLRDAIVRTGAVRVLVLDARKPHSAAAEPATLGVLSWVGIGLLGGGVGVWALTYLGTALVYAAASIAVRASDVDAYALNFVPVVGPATAVILLGPPGYAPQLGIASTVSQVLTLTVAGVGGCLWALDALGEE